MNTGKPTFDDVAFLIMAWAFVVFVGGILLMIHPIGLIGWLMIAVYVLGPLWGDLKHAAIERAKRETAA